MFQATSTKRMAKEQLSGFELVEVAKGSIELCVCGHCRKDPERSMANASNLQGCLGSYQATGRRRRKGRRRKGRTVKRDGKKEKEGKNGQARREEGEGREERSSETDKEEKKES